MFADINNNTAKGSKTNTNTMITSLTASSKWSCAFLPYISSATYFNGLPLHLFYLALSLKYSFQALVHLIY